MTNQSLVALNNFVKYFFHQIYVCFLKKFIYLSSWIDFYKRLWSQYATVTEDIRVLALSKLVSQTYIHFQKLLLCYL